MSSTICDMQVDKIRTLRVRKLFYSSWMFVESFKSNKNSFSEEIVIRKSQQKIAGMGFVAWSTHSSVCERLRIFGSNEAMHFITARKEHF